MGLFPIIFAAYTQADALLFGFLILFVFVFVAAVCFLGAWSRRTAVGLSPYTGVPLRRASDLPYETARRVLQFMYDRREYDNRVFKFKNAAFCRETGMIFQDCATWLDTLHVDWTFLNKRYHGHYVSWGSLTEEQQEEVRKLHRSLDGFQTTFSSKEPAPSAVDPDFIHIKPGPLYVDVEKHVILGWQRVPNTEFQVLIVQKPKQTYKT